ncbi:78 kDa glucose-regulated protein [Planoprotostelium fungivorum]|uniref:78 kDa glucose-regulated protein n=1 Tax=Planoprotostelium fungivorum TaxID=1890364 RepID=A0A2P6MQK1_9EUKA|nr:78 kDa glucose-regulated protein [Planoprotostelium fungivorum]
MRSGTITYTLAVVAILSILLPTGGALEDDRVEWPVIGIDLGTAYSCVSVAKDGQVEILENDLGDRLTPSYVAFTDTETLIGEAAKSQAVVNPENTVFDVKRLMGRKYNDPEVQRDKKLYPFEIIEKDSKPYIRVTVNGEKKSFSPEEIKAMILTKMKETAEAKIGKPVKNAILTCPTYFNDAQRQATKEAGILAGLDVQRIINEPTAAALAYGLDKKGEKNVLVFDLGGAFDVSVLTIEDGIFELLSTNGDPQLRGEYFDRRVIEHILEVFKEKTGKDASSNRKAIQKLRREIEKANRQLISQHQVTIKIESFHDGLDLTETLTRVEFEQLNSDLFDKILKPVQHALDDAKKRRDEIDEIVLVGGSTRMPKVQQLLKEFFNGKELNKGIDPDEAVAHGAAIQGWVLSQQDPFIIVCDSAHFTLGIETAGGVMTPIIHRYTLVPTKKSLVFSTYQDNQDTVSIKVFEGERSMTKDNHFLGKLELTGIPPAPRGVPQIEVSLSQDFDGDLVVSVEDKGTGNKNAITIMIDARYTSEEIERLIRGAEIAAEEDKLVKERVEAVNELENYEDVKNAFSVVVKETLSWSDENRSVATKKDVDELQKGRKNIQSVNCVSTR